MLEQIEFFRDLNPRELEQISNITVGQAYKRGEIIFRQGDFSRDFYFIKTGQVEISVKDFLNERKVLSILKNGDFFGEMALFDKESSRSATAQAAQNCVLLRIPGSDFEGLLNNKPTISFKLLSSLSKRLKDSNAQKIAAPSSDAANLELPKAKVISVASARNGYGKTTFATGLAHLLAGELPRKVLFIDLDFNYGDGTFVLGVFSPKSMVQFSERMRSGTTRWEDLVQNLVHHSGNLFTLPAPKDFIESEKIQAQDLIPIIKICRQHFDYIVMDTSSGISDVFLNALDLSDLVLILVKLGSPIDIKSNSLFFRGLSNLSLPEDRVKLLMADGDDTSTATKAQKMFKFGVLGSLPKIPEFRTDDGKTVFQFAPNSAYCDVLRSLGRDLLNETGFQRKSESGFISRLLFSPRDKGSETPRMPGIDSESSPTDQVLSMDSDNYSSVVKYIRMNISSGYLDQALADANRLIDICPNASQLFQMIGEIYYHQKNFSPAMEATHKAVDLDPENYMALAYQSLIESKPELMDKALGILKGKLQGQPEFPDILTEMAKVFYLSRNLPEAEAACLKALEKNTGYPEARIQLAMIQGETQRYDEAIKTLLVVKPKTVRIYYMLGQNFFSAGQFFHSLQAFTLVSEINPSYQDTGSKMEQLKNYFQKVGNLLQIHLDLKKSSPNYPDIHYKIGNISMLLGKRDEAIAEYKEALRLYPGYTDARKRIDELNAKPDVFIDFAPQSDTLVSLGILSQKPKFFMEIKFEKVADKVKDAKNGQEFQLTIRNLRNSRSIQLPLNVSLFKKGTMIADCGSLEPIFPSDILLIQIGVKGSKEIMASLPRVISIKDLQAGKGHIDLSSEESKSWYYPFSAESPFQMPLKNFFVSLQCPDLAKSISGADSIYKAEIRNFNTEAVAQGHVNDEDPNKVGFVFISQNGKDVVREGDKLHLRVLDSNNNLEVLAMDFPVLKEDVDEFCKSIGMDVLGFYFKPDQRPVEKAKEKAKEKVKKVGA